MKLTKMEFFDKITFDGEKVSDFSDEDFREETYFDILEGCTEFVNLEIKAGFRDSYEEYEYVFFIDDKFWMFRVEYNTTMCTCSFDENPDEYKYLFSPAVCKPVMTWVVDKKKESS